jgi:hypothetical protein
MLQGNQLDHNQSFLRDTVCMCIVVIRVWTHDLWLSTQASYNAICPCSEIVKDDKTNTSLGESLTNKIFFSQFFFIWIYLLYLGIHHDHHKWIQKSWLDTSVLWKSHQMEDRDQVAMEGVQQQWHPWVTFKNITGAQYLPRRIFLAHPDTYLQHPSGFSNSSIVFCKCSAAFCHWYCDE